MNRGTNKHRLSYHSKQRFKERYEGEEDKEILFNRALNYGVCFAQIPFEFGLKTYVFGKEEKNNKKVKLLDGYVFVSSKANRLITMYKIPEEYADELPTINAIQQFNKENYKRNRAKIHSGKNRG